jgi:hypothetical protein
MHVELFSNHVQTLKIMKERGVVCLHSVYPPPVKMYYDMQGSPHLLKTGRLDFSLRDHEGEVKA